MGKLWSLLVTGICQSCESLWLGLVFFCFHFAAALHET